MKNKDLINKAVALTRKLEELREDGRVRDVLGFLHLKNLLVSTVKYEFNGKKISIIDALFVGEHFEPRVLEVLPAAILKFPSAWKNLNRMPEDLVDLLKAICSGEEARGDFRGIAYKNILKWCHANSCDRRTVPTNKYRVTLSLRLTRDLLKRVKDKASNRGVSVTSLVQEAIEKAIQ